jgi:repressor LexA
MTTGRQEYGDNAIHPSDEQIAAARLRLVLDRRTGKDSSVLVQSLGRMPFSTVGTGTVEFEHGIEQSDVPGRREADPSSTHEIGSIASESAPYVRRTATVTRTYLTERQRRILETVRNEIERVGRPPSVREIGEAVGLTSNSLVARELRALERKGFIQRDPNRPRAISLPPSEVADPPESDSAPVSVSVPVLGRIVAGGPILAERATDAVFPLPREIVGEGSLFALRVVGDSMIDAAIADGDWVIVRQAVVTDDGAVVAAMIDNEATIRVLRRVGRRVLLLPMNPAYEPINGDGATILGLVVAVLRRL